MTRQGDDNRGLVRIFALSADYPSSGIVVAPSVDPIIVLADAAQSLSDIGILSNSARLLRQRE